MKSNSTILTLAFLVISLNSFSQSTGKMTDKRDGKEYKTVKIGTQTWMAENLAFKSPEGWKAYDNLVSNVKLYGYLYNWITARKICPTGWHTPSDKDWTKLVAFLGGDKTAGQKLKGYWGSRSDSSNISGFTALPGGMGFYFGEKKPTFKFSTIGKAAWWWSSTDSLSRYLDDYVGIYRSKSSPDCFFSVRCLKN
jgi:uncharacterized protein (TIGR02145 family)